MPTYNSKSPEAFVAALLQQKDFEGMVEGVGYVQCKNENTWLVPKNPSRSIPRGKGISSKIYKVSIERVDKDKFDNTPYFKKRFPQLTNEALSRVITSRLGSNKEVQIGRGLYYELLISQQLSVKINFTTGDVTLRLPNTQTHNGIDYPRAVRSGGVSDAQRENTVSLDDIQQGVLGANAKYLLIGDQEITSHPYEVKIDYWDMLQNFGEYRPYIFGNKFTISFGAELTAGLGVSGSLDLTWLMDGKDSSIYPYFTTTRNRIVSSGGGGSIFFSGGFGVFEGQNLDRTSLKGDIKGGEVSGSYGMGGGIGGSMSINTDDIWTSGYISFDIIGYEASPLSGASFKGFVGYTTEALQLSPQEIIKYINEK